MDQRFDRRTLLAALPLGLLASRLEAGDPATAAPSPSAAPAGNAAPDRDGLLVVRVATSASPLPFRIEEFAEQTTSRGVLHAADEAGLTLFLRRTAVDPLGPRRLRLEVADGTTLEHVFAAVRGVDAGGFATLRYAGCVPTGCGRRTGEAGAPRLDNEERKTSELLETLARVSTYC